jgi:hypothetical protein
MLDIDPGTLFSKMGCEEWQLLFHPRRKRSGRLHREAGGRQESRGIYNQLFGVDHEHGYHFADEGKDKESDISSGPNAVGFRIGLLPKSYGCSDYCGARMVVLRTQVWHSKLPRSANLQMARGSLLVNQNQNGGSLKPPHNQYCQRKGSTHSSSYNSKSRDRTCGTGDMDVRLWRRWVNPASLLPSPLHSKSSKAGQHGHSSIQDNPLVSIHQTASAALLSDHRKACI